MFIESESLVCYLQLNLPLDIGASSGASNGGCQLVSDPRIFYSGRPRMKLLAHSSGAVYLFQLDPNRDCSDDATNLSYSIFLLHHNKNIHVTTKLPAHSIDDEIKLDLCLHSKGQLLVYRNCAYE